GGARPSGAVAARRLSGDVRQHGHLVGDDRMTLRRCEGRRRPPLRRGTSRTQDRLPPVFGLGLFAPRGDPVSAHAPTKPRSAHGAQVAGEKVVQSSGFEWLARAGFGGRGLRFGITGTRARKPAVVV